MTFDVAAESYERFMGGWARALAAPFLAAAGVGHRGPVLDVGAGTGALTGALVDRLGPASVSAVEPSASFAEALRSSLPGVEVREAHAEALPFPAGSFDAVLAQLVVHFLADPLVALAEMTRVAAPGGRIACTVWDFAGDRAPLSLFWSAAREVDPGAVDERHLPGAARGDLAALLVAVGLTQVRDGELTVERPCPRPDAWWETYTLGVGPAGAYLAACDPALHDRIRRRCLERLPRDGRPLTATAWFARGTVSVPA